MIIYKFQLQKVQNSDLVKFYRHFSQENHEIQMPKVNHSKAPNISQSTQNEFYQLPEFGPSCRKSDESHKYMVADVIVRVSGQGTRIGGDVRKCLSGLTGSFSKTSPTG